jgi:multiple sugar transport system substrate-binding protein
MSRGTFRVAVRKFGPFESAIVRQWDAFEQSAHTGLHFKAEALELHPLMETLFQREGLKRGDWDVAFVNTDWVAAADDTHCLVDLAPLLAADPPADYPDGWTPSLLRLQTVGARVLGLPYHDGPECLIYRRDLFEDATERAGYERRFGGALRVPRTWDEFQRVAQWFNRPAQQLYGTTFAAFSDGHNTVYDFCLQLWTRGGELFDTQGEARIDSPAAVDGLEYYRLMLNDPSAVHPRSRDFDSVKSGLAFASGHIAMMVNWFGFAAMSETIADSQVKGRVGIAEIPHAEGGCSTSLNIYWILSIGAGSRHRSVAYRFLRHCASPAMDKLLTLEGGIGCRKTTWHDPDVNRAIPFYSSLERLHENAREMPRLSSWPKFAAIIDDLMLGVINRNESVPALARRAQERLRLGPETNVRLARS